MPRPDRRRVREYSRKGADWALRELRLAPEQRQARGLTQVLGPDNGDGSRVLFVCPRDWAEHVHYQAVLGQALRIRGARVNFLGCGGGLEICDRANTYEAPPMPCRTCHGYVDASLRAHRFALRHLSDWWGSDGGIDWPELDEISREDLVSVENGGLALGELVDIPLKWFLCAADLDDDPLASLTTRRFLRSARRIQQAAEAALDELRPDVVVLLNGLFLFESIIWEVCRRRGIDVVTYERAFLKETLVFSRDVPAGFYDLSSSWDPTRRLHDSEEQELDDYLAARSRGDAFDQFWSFGEASLESQQGRLVSLFTNLTWDTAVIGRDSAFPGIRSWLEAVVTSMAARPQHRLVIRVHPSEQFLPGKVTRDSLESWLADQFPDLPPNVTVVGAGDVASSYPLMEASDVGLVYTSTTGLELALRGVPVIVAGKTHYRGKGFTHDVSDPVQFERVLDDLLELPSSGAPDVDLARRYAHFFFFEAPVSAPGVIEPWPGLARLTIDSLDDLRPGVDADLDLICDGILTGVSFVGAKPGL